MKAQQVDEYSKRLETAIEAAASEQMETKAYKAASAFPPDSFPMTAYAYAVFTLLVTLDGGDGSWYQFLREALNEAINSDTEDVRHSAELH